MILTTIRNLNSMEEIRYELGKHSKYELLQVANELQLTGVKSYTKARLIEAIATTQKFRIESQILATVDIKSDWQR